MAGALVLPFLGGAGAAGGAGAGLAGAGAGSAAAGAGLGLSNIIANAAAAPAVGAMGGGMADILGQAAAAPVVGSIPSIARGIAPKSPETKMTDYLDRGIRLGQLAGIGPSEKQQPQAQAPYPVPQEPPVIQGPAAMANPQTALAQPFTPSAVNFIDLFNRYRYGR